MARPGSRFDRQTPSLPTPPLELSGHLASVSGRDQAASAAQDDTPSELLSGGARTGGLGDRRRSVSPQEITDHWELIRSTIPMDETLPSSESSFADLGAISDPSTHARLANLMRLQRNDNLSPFVEHPSRGPGPAATTSYNRELDCIYPSDTESDVDDEMSGPDVAEETIDRPRSGSHTLRDVEHELRSLRREYQRMSRSFRHFRSDYGRLERELADYSRNNEVETETDEPEPQQPSRFESQVRRRAHEMALATRRTYDDPYMPSMPNMPDPLQGFDLNALLNDGPHEDEDPEFSQTTDVASARLLMQDSADMLDSLTREVRESQSDELESMLARRTGPTVGVHDPSQTMAEAYNDGEAESDE